MLTAEIFDIQRFSVDDGPGIRTTVFFQGCSLDCAWCHNPEGKVKRNRVFFNEMKCVSCKICESVCPAACHKTEGEKHLIYRDSCLACGKCAAACPNSALRFPYRTLSVDEAFEAVVADEIFYKNSGGGVTLSGGEPLLQAEFAAELASRLKKRGIHVCIETAAYVPEESVAAVAELCDLFLFDIKETDAERHKAYTGKDNSLILENLRFIDSLGKKIVIRCPLIPGLNLREEHAEKLCELVNSLTNVERVELLPYHSLGLGKYRELGLEASYANDSFMPREDADVFLRILQKSCKVEAEIV